MDSPARPVISLVPPSMLETERVDDGLSWSRTQENTQGWRVGSVTAGQAATGER